jgi:hypothetical protein
MYLFPFYSVKMKSVQQYSEEQTQNIFVVQKNCSVVIIIIINHIKNNND